MIADRAAGRPAVALGLFVAVSLLARAPFLTVPCLDLDEAAQLVGSWELMHGGTLYVDGRRQPSPAALRLPMPTRGAVRSRLSRCGSSSRWPSSP
jgi:hypothetical protein